MNIQYLQELCDYLCEEYDMEHHEVVADKFLRDRAVYDLKNKRIILRTDLSDEIAEISVYHEFRHGWQAIHYPDMYLWWLAPDNKKRDEEYSAFYGKLINSIEADALTFGFSKGKRGREDCLEFFTVEQLDFLSKENQLFDGNDFMSNCLPSLQGIY